MNLPTPQANCRPQACAQQIDKELLKISFGGIPNSSSLMPCFTTRAHSCSAVVLPMQTVSSPKGVQKQSHGCSCQGCKATNHTLRNPPEPSGSCIRNLPPEPASGTYTSTHRNPPEPSGTYTSTNRNPPKPWEPASATYTSTHRNLLEPSGTCLRNLHHHTPGPSRTCLRNLHQHTPEPCGTFRNLPPETTPALRNLPELASGTYTSTHRNPPEPSGTCLRNLLLRPAPAHTVAYLG